MRMFHFAAVQCSGQQDCDWLSDEAGDVVCTDRVQTSDGQGELVSTCLCSDMALADNITGQCMIIEAEEGLDVTASLQDSSCE